MNIGEYIKNHAKEEGHTLVWVADELEINYKTFMGKLKRNILSAEELLRISSILDINLEFMKCEVDYSVKSSRKYIYIAENISDEESLNKEKISSIPVEVREDDYLGNIYRETVYAFNEVLNEDGTVKYEIKEINARNLKQRDNVTGTYMLRVAQGSSFFIKGKKNAGGTF